MVLFARHDIDTRFRDTGGKRVDVRPNWKEQPKMPTKLRYD
jgi:hypothetical protein